jgi:hypothetical protein
MDDNEEPRVTSHLIEDHMPRFPSQPLRQLSQGEVNSKSPKRSISPEKELPPVSVHSTDPSKEPSSASSNNARMNDAIAALLAQKKQVLRPTSIAPEEEVDALTKRRKGKLGRAISGSFGSNTSKAFSRDNSTDATAFVPLYEAGPKVAVDQAPPAPSQKVLYEDETREEKAKLIARLGGKVIESDYDSTVVLKSIGTVKELMVGDLKGLRSRRGRG